MLNSSSEILSPHWLYKLAANLSIPDVGMVGATASYESLAFLNRAFPKFPNIHIRTNAFMIARALFCNLTKGVAIADKMDAHLLESGPDSLSQQVLSMGKEILVVGRNGRGYSPPLWPTSGTFRLGNQENLLISDNRTRQFSSTSPGEKEFTVHRTWGRYKTRIPDLNFSP